MRDPKHGLTMRSLAHALRTLIRGVAGDLPKPTCISAAVIMVCLMASGCRDSGTFKQPALSEKDRQLFAAQLMHAYIRYAQTTGVPLQKLGITLKTDPAGATCTAKCEVRLSHAQVTVVVVSMARDAPRRIPTTTRHSSSSASRLPALPLQGTFQIETERSRVRSDRCRSPNWRHES
jgi:hypothetical protein